MLWRSRTGSAASGSASTSAAGAGAGAASGSAAGAGAGAGTSSPPAIDEPGGSARCYWESPRKAVRPPGSKGSLSLSRVGQHDAIGNRYGTQCSHPAQRDAPIPTDS